MHMTTTTRETLDEIWNAHRGESNRVGKFQHIAMLLGYSKVEVEAFLDAPHPGYRADDEDDEE